MRLTQCESAAARLRTMHVIQCGSVAAGAEPCMPGIAGAGRSLYMH